MIELLSATFNHLLEAHFVLHRMWSLTGNGFPRRYLGRVHLISLVDIGE